MIFELKTIISFCHKAVFLNTSCFCQHAPSQFLFIKIQFYQMQHFNYKRYNMVMKIFQSQTIQQNKENKRPLNQSLNFYSDKIKNDDAGTCSVYLALNETKLNAAAVAKFTIVPVWCFL